jgi:hypothetical protein
MHKITTITPEPDAIAYNTYATGSHFEIRRTQDLHKPEDIEVDQSKNSDASISSQYRRS